MRKPALTNQLRSRWLIRLCGYIGTLDQMPSHCRRGFPDAFIARRIKTDMDVFTAPALLIKFRYACVVIIGGGLLGIENLI